VPYIVVVGDEEVKTGELSVRIRNGENKKMALQELLKEIKDITDGMPFKKLSLPLYVSRRPVFRG